MDNSAVRHGVSAVVEFDYTAKEQDELSLVKGAMLHNIKVQKGGWWEGTITATGRTGMFPDNFVKVLEPDAKNPVVLRDKSATASRRCKAVYSYTQNNQDELTLAVGDVIDFLDEVEEGWWRGRLAGRTGVFPSNFVAMETQTPALAANRPSSMQQQQQQQSTNNTSNSSHSHSTSSSSGPTTSSGNGPAAAAAAAVAYAAAAVAKQMHGSRDDLATAEAAPVAAADAPSLPPKPVRELCKVLYPYTPANDDELELRDGEIITILSRELPDKGWLKGELRGKIGVFPDNFVELISPEVSPIKESPSGASIPERPPASTKMLIKNPSLYASATSLTATSSTVTATSSNSTSSNINTNSSITTATASSNNHHSTSSVSAARTTFGSRDSLNESAATIIPAGNVASHRKSLEKHAFEIAGGLQPPSAAATAAATAAAGAGKIEKPVRKSFDPKAAAGSDFRKSMESLDEKVSPKGVPPVLKKPLVPVKKSPTGVAGLLSGIIKSKVGGSSGGKAGVELAKSATADNLDGAVSSRSYNLANDQNVIGERIRRGDQSVDFDQVERGQSILQDMRAGRAKAPKRRPPTSAINSQSSSESSAGDSVMGAGHQNGSSDATNGDGAGPHGDADSASDDAGRPRQPAARNWEKQKAPWMDELRASQAKKISPMDIGSGKSLDHDAGVGEPAPRAQHHLLGSGSVTSASFDMSKSFSSAQFVASSSASSGRKSTEYTHLDETTATTAAASATATTTVTESAKRTEFNNNHSNAAAASMVRSMGALSTSTKANFGSSITSSSSSSNNNTSSSSSTIITNSATSAASASEHTAATAATVAVDPAKKPRPTSVNLRTRSISPIGRMSSVHIGASSPPIGVSVLEPKTLVASMSTATAATTTTSTSNHDPAPSTSSENVCARVVELELKCARLERIVQQQQHTIDEVLRAARDESERVRALRAELDKYAQCVTQV